VVNGPDGGRGGGVTGPVCQWECGTYPLHTVSSYTVISSS